MEDTTVECALSSLHIQHENDHLNCYGAACAQELKCKILNEFFVCSIKSITIGTILKCLFQNFKKNRKRIGLITFKVLNMYICTYIYNVLHNRITSIGNLFEHL
jgi:hypothetical protein